MSELLTDDQVRETYQWGARACGCCAEYRDEDGEAFDAWLAAHDAEVRASVLAEQGEPEWEATTEYAYGTIGTDVIVPTGEDIDDLGTARYNAEEFWLNVLQRTVRRGPWVPVEENGENA